MTSKSVVPEQSTCNYGDYWCIMFCLKVCVSVNNSFGSRVGKKSNHNWCKMLQHGRSSPDFLAQLLIFLNSLFLKQKIRVRENGAPDFLSRL